jgi:hypothetical protein
MGELIDQMNGQMAELPQTVQYWVNWMLFIFFASVFFVWTKKAARYALLAMVLVMPVAMLIVYLSGTVHLIGVAHLLLWGPLFFYLLKVEIKREGFEFKSIYGVWLGLLMATIAVSLVFDIRDIFLVVTGGK